MALVRYVCVHQRPQVQEPRSSELADGFPRTGEVERLIYRRKRLVDALDVAVDLGELRTPRLGE
jgi:hypothetical protein